MYYFEIILSKNCLEEIELATKFKTSDKALKYFVHHLNSNIRYSRKGYVLADIFNPANGDFEERILGIKWQIKLVYTKPPRYIAEIVINSKATSFDSMDQAVDAYIEDVANNLQSNGGFPVGADYASENMKENSYYCEVEIGSNWNVKRLDGFNSLLMKNIKK
jgi:site-specific DNA-adenine methylase